MPAKVKKDPYLYFLYSETQEKERIEIEKKMSRVFNCGTVIVNGRAKKFSEISKKSPKNRYADCVLVAEGLESAMKYTPITTTLSKI